MTTKVTELSWPELWEDTSSLVTPFRDAVAELRRRSSDAPLQRRVRQLQAHNNLGPLAVGNKGVLARPVASAIAETGLLLHHCRLGGLSPTILEYPGTKMVGRNIDKQLLVRPLFQVGRDRHGAPILRAVRIAKTREGAPLSHHSTCWGESLVGFHHRLLTTHFPEIANSVHDVHNWLAATHTLEEHWYAAFLSHFVVDAIWFETFLLADEAESEFVRRVIRPGFERVVEECGVPPLICPLIPEGKEYDRASWTLPAEELPRCLARLPVEEHVEAEIPRATVIIECNVP